MAIDNRTLDLWNDIHLISDIPFWIAKMDEKKIYAYPHSIEKSVHSYYFDYLDIEVKRHMLENDMMLTFVTDYYYIILAPLDENTVLGSVPLATQRPAPMPFNFVRHFVVEEESSNFVNMIAHTRIQTIQHAMSFVNLIKIAYNGRKFNEIKFYRHIPNQESDLDEIARLDREGEINAQSDFLFQNQSLFSEKEVERAIKNGDVEAFKQHMSKRIETGLGHISTNPLQEQKYRAAIIFSVFTKAAISGGLDVQVAYAISDSYCLEMDTMKTVSAVQRIIIMAGEDFCNKVRELKGKQEYSTEISKCVRYIYSHLYAPIMVSDLEPIANMNRRSLTIKFKKETGMTIPKFVLEKKLNEACYLLKTTDMEIGDISYLLCFSSQSHFTSRFREMYGVTPREYREKIKS